MVIKIMGMGCESCKKLYKLVEESVQELAAKAEIQKVEDVAKIMGYGVMRTPAIVINEKIKVFGRIPTKVEIKEYIEEEKEA